MNEQSGKYKVEAEADHDQFNILCENVESSLFLTNSVVQQIIDFNFSLSKYDLPTSMLLSFGLLSSKLHRNITDFIAQITELVRVTRIYSVSWEKKSQSLKKLHQKYNSKQRKLDIALNKLENLSGRNQQLEKQKVLMDWEKLFLLKLNEPKHDKKGWKHFIEEKKISAGEGAALNSQDVTKYSQFSLSQENIMDDVKKEFEKDDELYIDSHASIADEMEKDSVVDFFSDPSDIEEELRFTSRGDNSVMDWISRNDNHADTNLIDDPDKNDYYGDNEYQSNTEHHTEIESLQEVPEQPLKCSASFHEQEVEMFDKSTSTAENEYYYKVTFQVYAPKSINEKHLAFVVAFNDSLKKGETFSTNAHEFEASLELARTDSPAVSDTNTNTFQEFSFQLDFFFGEDILACEELLESKLRIAVHPGANKSMIAFTSCSVRDLSIVNYCDLDDKSDGERNPVEFSKSVPLNELRLLATVERDSLKFNQPCGKLHVNCFLTRCKKFTTKDQGTETISLNELIEDMFAAKRKMYLQRCKSAGIETEEKPVYTEDQMDIMRHQLAQEISELKNEYDIKLSEMLKVHQVDPADLVNMATSPILNWEIDSESQDMTPLPEGGNLAPPPSSSHTVTKSRPVSKQYGKNLPGDFITRLNMFQEASAKYHTQLKNTIKDITDEEITKKLKAERKLWKQGKRSVYSADVYLPALFMPIKTNLTTPPKARSFLTNSSRVSSTKSRSRERHSSVTFPTLKNKNPEKLVDICVMADGSSVSTGHNVKQQQQLTTG